MEVNTVKELIFWSYANLAMAHSAISNNQQTYSRVNFMIRSRLYKGLMVGKMNIGTIFDDEKIKMLSGSCCSYCGFTENLSIDHVFAQKFGGTDDADNLVCVCKSCNSSKGAKDMVEWFSSQDKFPPLLLLRRYLKLVYKFCLYNQLLDKAIDDIDDRLFPFHLRSIPIEYPMPDKLMLNF